MTFYSSMKSNHTKSILANILKVTMPCQSSFMVCRAEYCGLNTEWKSYIGQENLLMLKWMIMV